MEFKRSLAENSFFNKNDKTLSGKMSGSYQISVSAHLHFYLTMKGKLKRKQEGSEKQSSFEEEAEKGTSF